MKNLLAAIVDGEHDATIHLRTTPYHYLTIHPALPWDLYRQLMNERPGWRDIAQGETRANIRKDLSYRDVVEKRRGNPTALWLEFLEAHVTAEFYRDACSMLEIEDRTLKEDYQIIPRRMRSKNRLQRINMDCLVGINTPNSKGKPDRVRGPHVDFPGELWAGMLYMPHWLDSAGGDLLIYRSTKPPDEMIFSGKAEVKDEDVEEVDMCAYAPNTAVFFENGLSSLHGVGYRRPSVLPRQLVNFVAEVSVKQFDLRRK